MTIKEILKKYSVEELNRILSLYDKFADCADTLLTKKVNIIVQKNGDAFNEVISITNMTKEEMEKINIVLEGRW